METVILNSLNHLGYQGLLIDDAAFAEALEEGLKSLEFIKLIHILVEELKAFSGLEKNVSLISSTEESNSFLSELSILLKELKCPYDSLVTGDVSTCLLSKEERLLLLEYLTSELIAAKKMPDDSSQDSNSVMIREGIPLDSSIQDMVSDTAQAKTKQMPKDSSQDSTSVDKVEIAIEAIIQDMVSDTAQAKTNQMPNASLEDSNNVMIKEGIAIDSSIQDMVSDTAHAETKQMPYDSSQDSNNVMIKEGIAIDSSIQDMVSDHAETKQMPNDSSQDSNNVMIKEGIAIDSSIQDMVSDTVHAETKQMPNDSSQDSTTVDKVEIAIDSSIQDMVSDTVHAETKQMPNDSSQDSTTVDKVEIAIDSSIQDMVSDTAHAETKQLPNESSQDSTSVNKEDIALDPSIRDTVSVKTVPWSNPPSPEHVACSSKTLKCSPQIVPTNAPIEVSFNGDFEQMAKKSPLLKQSIPKGSLVSEKKRKRKRYYAWAATAKMNKPQVHNGPRHMAGETNPVQISPKPKGRNAGQLVADRLDRAKLYRSDTTTGFSKCIKPATNQNSSQSIELCVAVTVEPYQDLTKQQAMVLLDRMEFMFMDELLNPLTTTHASKIHFRGKPHYSNGVLKLWCEDDVALTWLHHTVETVQSPITNTSLIVRPQAEIRVECSLFIPTHMTDINRALQILTLHNQFLNINNWVLARSEKKDDRYNRGISLLLHIPQSDADEMKRRDRRMYWLFGNIYLRMLENKLPNATVY